MKTQNLAFVDVETSGLNPDRHEIIELALIVARQIPAENGKRGKLEIIFEKDWKIKMTKPENAEQQALRINGYNEADWIFAIDLVEALKEFNKAAEGASFVSHNLTFDYAFISRAFEKTGITNKMHYAKLDTISIAFARLYDLPQVNSFSLKALADLFKIENKKAHTALADTITLVEIYKKMMGLQS
jgi:DNA polymerase III subunit epsilon